MIPRRILPVLALVATAATGIAPAAAPQTQTFRTSVDAVVVDVSVRSSGRLVEGLRAADFDVRDNGVRQAVEIVEAVAVPIDLTLVVDVSAHPRLPEGKPGSAEAAARRVSEEVARVARRLRPIDRLRVLTVDRYVHQVVSIREGSTIAPIEAVASGGLASLYDGLIAALLQPVDPDRRHVVIAGVKNHDTMSAMDVAAVRDVAARSDAWLHVVVLETAAANEAQAAGFRCELESNDVLVEGVCQPTARFWTPHVHELFENLGRMNPDGSQAEVRLTQHGRALRDAVEQAGGVFHRTELFSEPSLAGVFSRVVLDFDTRYLLRYTPTGVAREGRHVITVAVPGSRGAVVRARRGYSVAPAASPALPPPVPTAGARSAAATLEALIATYVRAESAREAIADPAALIQAFLETRATWPGTFNQEAAFALELAEIGLASPSPSPRIAAANLLRRYAHLVRHPLGPDEFERAWLTGQVTLLQGRLVPGGPGSFVDAALQRFPHEPAFLLAKAIAIDRALARSGISPADAVLVRAAYGVAAAHAATAAEARLRLAWFLHRAGRHDEALEQFGRLGAADRQDDPWFTHLRHLLRGHTLRALDRLDDAIGEYRAATGIMWQAQTARVALMNALAFQGRTAEAVALARAIETTPPSNDPWWTYWQGDRRQFLSALAVVRERRR
jgi:tetratricopeptide (TPR) repeat protein